ncbi:HNH endonuclease [Nocardia sp. NPDC057663]|uniref:HNH endonuclease n=1 Tax=Nocardia sp. NPDC057663 TaxID=3346201 RepID=UPI00366BF6D1
MNLDEERALRAEIFAALDELVAVKGGALTRPELFDFNLHGRPLPLVDRNRGIRNPVSLASTLSIMTKPGSEYTDEVIGESLHTYAYTKTPADKGDNVKLRHSVTTGLPMIFLQWINVDGIRYVPIYPVYAIKDDLANRRIVLALDEKLLDVDDPLHLTPVEKRYAQRLTDQRLHQPQFRSQVLFAYKKRCAVCRLGRPELLEAAHIIGDKEQHGSAEIANGLSLCRIHHTVFDCDLVGISPDLRVHIGPAVMDADNEGPILKFALKGMDKAQLLVPSTKKYRPSADRLAERFEQFKIKSGSAAGIDVAFTKPIAWQGSTGSGSPARNQSANLAQKSDRT